ncbi:MAG: DNRLRE domain-containing protein, partial [Sporichthyaceae bacterium]|nr:DNRLRE domain-containing protein [Sporichthyaceae bacterium]
MRSQLWNSTWTWRHVGRRLAVITAVALVAGGVGTAEAVAGQPARSAPVAPKELPAEAEDISSALLLAQIRGERIEVLSKRTETSTTWANPDGTLTSETASGPIRVKRDGVWRPIDMDLVAVNGELRPKVAPSDVALSAGGGRPFALLRRGQQSIGLNWATALPVPVVSGNTATYRDVVVNGDLVVTALKTGFSESLVLRERPSGPLEIRLPLSLVELSLEKQANRSFRLEDARGNRLSAFPPPQMWDSSTHPLSGEPAHQRDVATVLETGPDGPALVLRPDADFLADPALTYPVTIDPTLAPTTDTWVATNYPTSQIGSVELKAGTYDSGTTKARSYVKFDTSSFAGTKIVDADFKLWSYWSSTCSTSSSGVQVRRITQNMDYADITWSSQPTTTSTGAVTSKTALGYNSSCPDGWMIWDIDTIAQAWADGSANYGVQVKAVTETDSLTWRRYNSANYVSGTGSTEPKLVVTYNTAPATGTGLKAVPGTTGSPQYVTSLTPTLSYTASDPDGGTLTGRFELWEGSTLVYTKDVTGVPSGQAATWVVQSGLLVEGHTYKFRTKSYDGTLWSTAWSSWLTFTVDKTPPGTPFVSSTDYPADGVGHGDVGVPGSFTFSPAVGTTDLAAYRYVLGAAAEVRVTATGTKTVTITPTVGGQQTLTVRAEDNAGQISPIAATHIFIVGSAELLQPLDGATVAKRTKLELYTSASLTKVEFRYRRGPGAAEASIPLANLLRNDGTPVSTGLAPKVLISELGSKTALWNTLDTLGSVGGVVQVQAWFYTDTDVTPSKTSPWKTITVDPNGDVGETAEVGPGEVNLLTGDYSVDSTDVEEFGLAVGRVSSSRSPTHGWLRQGERLTANVQQVGTDTTGFNAGNSTIARSTARGHDSSDSLLITSSGGGTNYNAYAGLARGGALFFAGTQPGRTYRLTGWEYVPSATGLTGVNGTYGLRMVVFFVTPGGTTWVVSPKATYTDAWQELTLDYTVPADATESYIWLHNGHPTSGMQTFWDDLSLTEIVAPFGPEWAGGPAAGVADTEYASLRFPDSDIAQITSVGGGWVTFARSSADGSFFPEPGAEGFTLTEQSPGVYRLTELDGTVTEFTKPTGTTVYTPSATWTVDQRSTTQYVYDTTDSRALVTRVIAPVEPGVDDANSCTAATPARGCEVLEYTYATTTTAAGGTFGDFADRVKSIKVWSWDPVASAVNSVEVATYRYDTAGRLREVWDPRLSPALKTAYEYDSSGRVITLTPAGELPWRFDYGPAGWDLHPGRLLKVRRDALVAGTVGTLDGEIATSVVYGVPLLKSLGGPYDLNGSAVAAWGQTDAPIDVTAIFGPESPPATHTATATVPGTNGYGSATVHYLNANGQEVNVATPGGYVDTAEYDRFGNVVRTLDATNRLLALGQLADTALQTRWLDELGLTASPATVRADLLSTRHRYSPDGLDLLESTGPLTSMVLTRELVASGLPTLAAGTVIRGRSHVLTAYDEGKPSGQNYHLPTTVTESAVVVDPVGYPDADPAVTTHAYNAEKGGTSGWDLRMATTINVDAGSGGAQIKAYAVFDAQGRATKSYRVGASGTDARTVVAIFYTAGTNPDDAACGNRPEWAGQPCVVKPAGTITTSDGTALPAGMPNELPLRRTDAYSRWGEASQISETANGQTRTTVTTFDAADRIASVSISGDGGTALPAVTTQYDPATGDVVKTIAGGVEVSRTFDQLGRLLSYTDADGATTSNEFDRYGKPTKVTDPTGFATFGYDYTAEPRGFLTSVTDSVAGTFSAIYGPDGQIVSQTYPGGIVRADTLDPTGAPVARTYTAPGGVTLWSESVVENTFGLWTSRTGTFGQRSYGYDRTGRLTRVDDTEPGGNCTVRVYGYDARTNRASQRSTLTPGSCVDGGVNTSFGYDTADRLLATAYGSDGFNRTVSGGWGTADVGGAWSNSGPAADFSVDGSAARAVLAAPAVGRHGTLPSASTTDSDTTFTVAADKLGTGNGIYVAANGRDVAGVGKYLSRVKLAPTGTVTLMLMWADTAGVTTNLTSELTVPGLTYAPGTQLRVRLQVTGVSPTTLKAKVWADGTAEPATWQQTATDSTAGLQVAGQVGFWSYLSGSATNAPIALTVDNFGSVSSAAYGYDGFGRVTTTPAGMAVEYFVNDLVQRQTLAEQRQSWTVDPTHRFRTFTTESFVGGAWAEANTKINHYGDDSDSPRWIVEDPTQGSITRNVAAFDGLAATTSATGDVQIQLADLHGDLVRVVAPDLSTVESYSFDE